jgi:hypothetical protein
MFAEHFAGAIERAPFHELTDLASKLWKAYEAKELDDGTAQRLYERIEARKQARKPRPDAEPPSSFRQIKIPRAPRQRSPDKARSIARRRRLARASPVPSEKVDIFTPCELAVIYIVVCEILLHGRCSLPIALIAARAGTCDTKVRDAIHKARAEGLFNMRERRRNGQKSQTNLIWIRSLPWGEWLRKVWDARRKKSWQAHPEGEPPGSRKTGSTDYKIQKEGKAGTVDRFGDGFSGDGTWSAGVQGA